MSSYLTFNLNGVDVLSMCRSSLIYSHCNAPFEDPKEVSVGDIRIALHEAKEYSKILEKRKRVLEIVLERATLDRDEIEGVMEEIEDIEEEIDENNRAISVLEVFAMILEENGYKDEDEEKAVLTWVKD